MGSGLERLDLLGLRALWPPAGCVLDPLVFLKAAVTVSLDGGVVNENVIGPVVRGDETVPLVGVEPLHSALSHVPSPDETIFGTHMRATRAGADRQPVRLGYGYRRRPLSKLRRRCDTYTNFDSNRAH